MSDWFREYSPGIIIRFLLMIGLWIFYGFIPHKLPFAAVFLVVGVFVWYGASLFRTKDYFMAYLLFFAAFLNTLIAFGLNPFIFVALTYAVLVFDVINTPQRGVAE